MCVWFNSRFNGSSAMCLLKDVEIPHENYAGNGSRTESTESGLL